MTSRSSLPTSASWALGPRLANNLLWNTDRERQNHTKQFCIYKEEKEMLSLGRLSENGWEWGAIEEQMWIKFSVPEEAERKEHANRKIWITLAIERTFCSSLKDSLSQLTQLLIGVYTIAGSVSDKELRKSVLVLMSRLFLWQKYRGKSA